MIDNKEIKALQKELLIQRTADNIFYFRNRDPFLLHRIPLADRNSVVFLRLVVDGNAERSTDGIHSPVSFANRIFFFVEAFKS